jgi:hypothetical protein
VSGLDVCNVCMSGAGLLAWVRNTEPFNSNSVRKCLHEAYIKIPLLQYMPLARLRSRALKPVYRAALESGAATSLSRNRIALRTRGVCLRIMAGMERKKL